MQGNVIFSFKKKRILQRGLDWIYDDIGPCLIKMILKNELKITLKSSQCASLHIKLLILNRNYLFKWACWYRLVISALDWLM